MKPIYIVRDPHLIKQLTIKDFDFFTDHRVLVTEDVDVLFGKSLIALTGQKWKGLFQFTVNPNMKKLMSDKFFFNRFFILSWFL